MKLPIRLLAGCLCFGLCVGHLRGDELDAGFRQPPPSARPWVYWVFMDGNLTREGITADLEAMQRAGIGGAIMMEVDVGIPRGPVHFMSDEWRALFKHAVAEAARLGLQLDLITSPGWTGTGGPWVKPEQSMQHLVSTATPAHGPTRFDAKLPQPQPRPPFFGTSGVPAELENARLGFYRDVAVLAFPTPAAAPGIADLDEKALYLRAPYSSQPGVKPFLPAPADYPALPAAQCVDHRQIVDITDRLSPDGHLNWEVPAGDWMIVRFGRTSTGQNTRPAPLPGLGFECDKFDPAALDAHFDAYIGLLLKDVAPYVGKSLVSIHLDSWEMSAQNWTGDFRAEFKQRHGYDPLPFLPALSGVIVDSLEVSERFLWDLRQTAQELVVQNHAERLRDLAHKHGLTFSLEPYDMNPCADLTLGGPADVPMGEFWSWGFGFDTDYSVFEAVSIAHVNGRPVVGAEAFTADSPEHWLQYPGRMKPQGDWAFCSGINRIVFHRYQHQPTLDRAPGMTMGPYGVHWERTQTWWDMVPAYHQYLARCQFLLQRGLPVADILYLAPEGAPHVFRPPADAVHGEHKDRRGFSFDGCSPEALLSRVSVRDGQLVMPDGPGYRVLVLPEFETMTPRLLRKIRDLVQTGATVVGTPPRKSPSLTGYPKCDAEVAQLAQELWGTPESDASSQRLIERRFGQGRIYRPAIQADKPIASAPAAFRDIYPSYELVAGLLTDLGQVPDFESDPPLRYTHRMDGDADVYFVANPTDRLVSASATFRVHGKRPELWNPLTGEERRLPEFMCSANRTTVPLRLEPYESFFVVFREPGKPDSPGHNFADLVKQADVTGPWQVEFQPNRGAPATITLDQLIDWSKHADPGVQHFSGEATYRATFDLPESALQDRTAHRFLDLGDVQVMARVTLNGHDLGVVWSRPFHVEVTEAVKTGANALEIRVANLWPNRLIGDSALPEGQRIASTTWNPFKPNTPLLPSGLLGPVQLLAEATPRSSVAQDSKPAVALTADGRSDYRIVIAADAALLEKQAAQELQDLIQRISGAALPIATDDQPPAAHEIILGRNHHLDALNITLDFDRLGDEGFVIRTAAPHLVIAGNAPRATLYGVYAFLEDDLGCRWFTPAVSFIPRKPNLALPEINRTEVPAMAYREIYYAEAGERAFAVHHKLNAGFPTTQPAADYAEAVTSGNGWAHTLFSFLPPEKYFEAHPEYYALREGKRQPSQPCLTNPDVLRIVVENLKQAIAANPKANYWSVSQMDNGEPCMCEKCKAIDDREGSPAGSLIEFINQVAAEFPDKYISTLAYWYTMAPPKSVKPAKNVHIMFCIDANHSAPFHDWLDGWAAIAPHMYIWYYVIPCHNFIAPWPNLFVMQPQIKDYVAHHASGMFNEGACNAGSEFAELRTYILAKLLWNPNCDVSAAIDDFLNGYYGPAAPALRKYVDTMDQSAKATGAVLDGHYWSAHFATGFLAPPMLAKYDALFDDAEKAVADNADLLLRVQHARMPLMHAELQLRYGDVDQRLALARKLLDYATRSHTDFFADFNQRPTQAYLSQVIEGLEKEKAERPKP